MMQFLPRKYRQNSGVSGCATWIEGGEKKKRKRRGATRNYCKFQRRQAAVATVVVVGESCAYCANCVFNCIWICCCYVLSSSSSLSFASCHAFELRARACVVFWMIEFVPSSLVAAMHSSIFAWWFIMMSECTVVMIAVCSRCADVACSCCADRVWIVLFE